MSWNPWIDIEPDDTADETAQSLYRKTRNPITGKISDLIRITSTTPKAAGLIKQLGEEVFGGAEGLTPPRTAHRRFYGQSHTDAQGLQPGGYPTAARCRHLGQGYRRLPEYEHPYHGGSQYGGLGMATVLEGSINMGVI